MINNEWERFGEDIRRTIQNAVDSRNFSRLNQTVSDTIGQAMDNISRGLNNGGWYRRPGAPGQSGPAGGPEYQTQNQPGQNPGGPADGGGYGSNYGNGKAAAGNSGSSLYLKGTSARIGGAFLAVTGGVFGIVSIAFLLFLVFTSISAGWSVLNIAGSAAIGIFTIAFAVMFGAGLGMASEAGRFRRYVKILQNREYCDVKELAARTGRSVRAVVKDLKRMIKKGWFRQGHLDEQETCLMVSDNAYRQYTGLMERMRREKAEKDAAAARAKQEYDRLSPEVQKIVAAGDEYVRKIREANDAIPGEEISAKISRMEMLVDRIFDRVEQNPASVDDIGKLMEYYLPTTIKLLEAYEDLDAQPVQGENILSSKREIEKTIDTLNTAFEKLLDDLFQDTSWDVSSDISVLQMMLAQDGLTEDGLKKKP